MAATSHSGLIALILATSLAGAAAGAMLPRAATLLTTTDHKSPATAVTPAPVPPTRQRRPAPPPPHRRIPTGLYSAGLAVASATIVWRLHTSATLTTATLTVWLTVLYTGTLLAAVDIAVRRLPTPVITTAAAIVLTTLAADAALTGDARQLGSAIAAGAALTTGYFLLALLLGSGIGLGDVRLAGLLGLTLGTLGYNAVLLGSTLPYLLAAPAALTRLIQKGDTNIAFGPYLVAGTLTALLLTM